MPIPPIPEFRRVHGPVTRFLLRRSLLVLTLCWIVGSALGTFGSSVGVRAFGFGLMLPGGGLLYTGHPVLAVVALLTFTMSLGLWWLCGIAVLPPAVWLAAAALAAATAGDTPAIWSIWAVPCLLVAAVAGSLLHQQVRFRVHRRRGRAYNRRLALEQPLRPVSAGPPAPREASAEDLKTLRYVLDLALQPHESWHGFFFVRPEQFREGAVRYQLNFISYTAAMFQYSCAPAFTGYVAEAQRNAIAKMLCRPVWSYWALENAWGNLRRNPDPIINDNVMYSGYLGLMLGLYETVTGDRRYHEPGCLRLRWNTHRTFDHDFGTITDAMVDNFGRSRLGQYPCEPNWIYPMCNTFAVNTLLVYDRLQHTDHAEPVLQAVRRGYDNGEFCEPDGRLTTARSSYLGVRHPMVGNLADAITALFLNPGLPDIGRRTWWLVHTFHLGPRGHAEDVLHRSWNRLDPGNYGINTDGFTRAALAANAREYGDEDSARALEESLADRLIEHHGACRYRGISVWGNLWLAFTRFGGEDAFRGLVRDGVPHEWRTGPVLTDAAYPDVMVARAVSDGDDLALVLRPGSGSTRTTIAIQRLRPHRTYRVRGARDAVVTSEVTADSTGRALVEFDLDDRLELHLYPAP
ncbi:hypothetical protein [Pseudonocardia sp.]|uniref:linalool dehydratase/isomerase domain-containing protein n=1 Tax=Pseudonocardia sp. TaxID=60912 RepID=UPI003D1251EE